jgi:hypothetical protein
LGRYSIITRRRKRKLDDNRRLFPEKTAARRLGGVHRDKADSLTRPAPNG